MKQMREIRKNKLKQPDDSIKFVIQSNIWRLNVDKSEL